MPFVSHAASHPVNPFLRLANEAVNCLHNGFRGDFAGAASCWHDSALHHLFNDAWQSASLRYQQHGAGLPGAADVMFACTLSAVTVGATYRYLWPELQALERACAAGEDALREWALDTDAQLRRRTVEEVTAMRQCLAAFDATQTSAHPPSPMAVSQRASATMRRKFAELRIAESLILHVADAPQATLAQSDRVVGLCQLLAHGLGFRLSGAVRQALNVSDDRPSLIRDDAAFALLRERLEPDWRNDVEHSPTFSVHPVDVQLFDPAQTTDDLSDDTRDARELLTHPEALRRVRSRVVALIAASVREDCGGDGDWRNLAVRALNTAAERGMPCERVLDAIGVATRASISARFAWLWTDEPVPQAGDVVVPTIPRDVAPWIARVMLVAGSSRRSGRAGRCTPCPPRLAALARGDTPASLVIGSTDWMHLVDGIGALGRDHWHATYAQVREAGRG
ncbi:hypothetical protein PEP31012_04432 [Pandoraea eparura]|uniref:Uncharacterized protein n=1 Tax=Pandoraea eparura TaxID=2508291 RepID=A0A5E4YAM9_9BURK|nr:hypothetical protein [Pandoraea eparura]VVE45819.1 hypothetical protein PEP31012_04432 [Pandoraea eparura]